MLRRSDDGVYARNYARRNYGGVREIPTLTHSLTVITRHWRTGLGRKVDEGDCSPRTQVRLHEEIITLLAGRIAEKRATGRANYLGARADHAAVADGAMITSGDEAQTNALLRWLELRAEALITQRWRAVEAVAAALLAEETLVVLRRAQV